MGDFIHILDKEEVKDAAYCEKLLREASNETTELLLAKKSLLQNCSMKRFHSLEALWLNDNKLTSIRGMDTNVQIKALYLHNNKISSLQNSSLKFLKHLQTLTLYNNRLRDLEGTLPLIRHLTHLEDLDLSGNPLANEVNYRLRVISTFPSLKVFDKHEVTEEERLEARKMFEGIKHSTVCFFSVKPVWQNPPKQPIACLSILTKDMYREIEKNKKKIEAKKQAEACAATEVLTSSMINVNTMPLATTVEKVTLNSKRLKDLVADFDFDKTRKADARKREKHRDFFAMKRFITSTVHALRMHARTQARTHKFIFLLLTHVILRKHKIHRRTHMHAFAYAYMHTFAYVHMHACAYMCVHLHVYKCIHRRTYLCI
jgi:hypothetical protein